MFFSYDYKQSHEADRRAVMQGTPARVFMERAGLALADTVEAAMNAVEADEALFVCGGGNNGGDGFIAARLLAERGRATQILCLAEKFSSDCARAKIRYKGEVLGRIPRRRYALVVECVLGTGLSRTPEGDAAALIAFINSNGAYVVSCDVPSGLSDNGIALTPCVRADETLTMGYMKNALTLADGVDVAGRVSIADIGISTPDKGTRVWEDEDVATYFPYKRSNVNKGTFGKAYLLSGGTRIGAVTLSARACLRSGCGYTFVCVPEAYAAQLGVAMPSCVVGDFHGLNAEILSADAVALGMGAGVNKELYELVVGLLNEYQGTLILDADALSALAAYGMEPLKKSACEVILTPHPKEFSRLTGRSVKEILDDALPLAGEFAREYGVTVILKNNRSIISNGIQTVINSTGTPALAKGGSGDVLSGLLVGTCARGVSAFEAACVSSFILGRAGELAEEETGDYGTTPEDVILKIPQAIASVRQ